MGRKEAEIKERQEQVSALCRDLTDVPNPIVHYIGAKLGQAYLQYLQEQLLVNGVNATVVAKGHEVHIIPAEISKK